MHFNPEMIVSHIGTVMADFLTNDTLDTLLRVKSRLQSLQDENLKDIFTLIDEIMGGTGNSAQALSKYLQS